MRWKQSLNYFLKEFGFKAGIEKWTNNWRGR
jgi:hypothetical protein